MKVRVSSSVEHFKSKINKTWKLKNWEGLDDPDQDVLYFGLYHDFDWMAFRNHEGKKTVFWCGGDILRLLNDPNRRRILKLYPETEHYAEMIQEIKELELAGIKAKLRPSFLDDVNDFPVSFKPTDKPHIWMCAHPDREEEYGIHLMQRMAKKFPDYTFHFYGIDGENYENVKYHGRIPEKQFNKEIKDYHCCVRTNQHDGFSELIMKSLLMGQYPISFLFYEKVWGFNDENDLEELLARLPRMKEPNLEAREYWINQVNKYPWM